MLMDGYFGTHIRSHYDVGYLVMWCAALTLLGLAQLRIVGRKVTPE
jgi:capsular polysaccharide transport system permease protein